jgi:hypothetical protein
MSYNENGTNMLQWFYPYSTTNSNGPNNATTTNFRINNIDISNNYSRSGINFNIPVSQFYNINYYINGTTNIGDLFELNLPVITGQINVDYKFYPVSGGTVIQILKSTTLQFNYNVNCQFAMIGGEGPGGNSANSNAGGGGGAGQLVTGNISGYTKGGVITITIGAGGTPGSSGGNNGISGKATSLVYSISDASCNAFGGGYGGFGKGDSNSVTGSSSGGSGSYSASVPVVGTSTYKLPSYSGIFQPLNSYNHVGGSGQNNNNDQGAGGGGGGAGGVGAGNSSINNGGAGITVTFGSMNWTLGGGGGGGGGQGGTGGTGGTGGGGSGGSSTSTSGFSGTPNTGGGGGGANNAGGTGGSGGSGTVLFYILSSGISLP